MLFLPKATKRKTAQRTEQTLVEGAFILTIGIVLVKLIGAVFKIPLSNIIGEAGMGYFNSAYSLYLPVYTVAAAGFPAALARQVSENMTLGRYRDVEKVRKIARNIFLITGTLGFLAMIVIGFVLTNLSISSNAIYSILMMSPSVFFCCMMSSYRGYNEGLRNMIPTAVSQVIEALVKLIFGLGLAVIIVKYGESQFYAAANVSGAAAAGGVTVSVFGRECHSLNDARNACYPFAAAATLFAISMGSAFGLLYMWIRTKKKGIGFTKEQLAAAPAPRETKDIVKTFFKIGIPIALGVLALNLTQLIDLLTIQSQLQKLSISGLRAQYGSLLDSVEDDPEEMSNFLYGAYSFGVTIYNLVPYIIQSLGTSGLPNLSAAWVINDRAKIKECINSVIKISILIAFPAGFGLFALAPEVLGLLYSGKAAATICIPMMRVLGIMVMVGSLAAPLNSMLQAIGKQDIPVKLMLVGAVIKIALNYILVGTQSINIKGAPYGSVACYAFIAVFSIIILCKNAKVKLDIMSTFVKPFISAGLCGLAAFGTQQLLNMFISSRITVVVSIGVAVIVYIISLFVLKAVSKSDIEMLPKGEKIAKTLEKLGWIV